jgi:hypothetical protein
MLAQKVFVKQILGDRLDARVELGSLKGHLSDDLKRTCILDRLECTGTPNGPWFQTSTAHISIGSIC